MVLRWLNSVLEVERGEGDKDCKKSLLKDGKLVHYQPLRMLVYFFLVKSNLKIFRGVSMSCMYFYKDVRSWNKSFVCAEWEPISQHLQKIWSKDILKKRCRFIVLIILVPENVWWIEVRLTGSWRRWWAGERSGYVDVRFVQRDSWWQGTQPVIVGEFVR